MGAAVEVVEAGGGAGAAAAVEPRGADARAQPSWRNIQPDGSAWPSAQTLP